MNATPRSEENTQPEPEAEPQPEQHVREIPGGAGHGPARVYGYIAVARALGASAVLTSGGTRSTSAHPLRVTVTAPEELFRQVNILYDEVAPAAEQYAAQERARVRKSSRFRTSYEVNLLTRAVLSGFPQGAASALLPPGSTAPLPLREATRARLANDEAHTAAVAAGREWAAQHLIRKPDLHPAREGD